MFSGTVETPRPLPPAKARRAAATLQKLSSTPPPAYGSPFTFPSRHASLRDQGHDYDASELEGDDLGHLPSPPPEDSEEWMSERSREELRDLLVRADGIIRERENELGVASAVAKGLYQSNVVLKSKHQELLARLPLSPVPSTSSPDLPYTATFDSHSRSNSASIVSTSTSDSALGLIRSPRPQSLYNPRPGPPSRKVAIATADISLLADQNAELLNKLEKLEAEATSADHAGRRELKRLEKEIAFLREALERTQQKSEELEEKVQDAVVGEVWRKKKEREARFRAMRGLGRERVREGEDEGLLGVRNFAPTGSRFGGPSERFSFFPSSEEEGSPEPRSLESSSSDGALHFFASTSAAPASARAPTQAQAQPQPDHNDLIVQLLTKVKELEETNTRILQQQTETANQLSAVQRDTAHITKVYETLADPEAVELSLDLDEGSLEGREFEEDEREGAHELRRRDSRGVLKSSTATTLTASVRKQRSAMRFVSLRRSIEDELALDEAGDDRHGTFVVHPPAREVIPPSAPRNRKSVMGLFDDMTASASQEARRDEGDAYEHAVPRLRTSTSSTSTTSWSEGEGAGYDESRSFWSSSSAAGAEAEVEAMLGSSTSPRSAHASASGRLSPLDFFSPALQGRQLPQHRSHETDSLSASASPDAIFNQLDLPSSLAIPSGVSTLQVELNSSLSQQLGGLHSNESGNGNGSGTGTGTGTGNAFGFGLGTDRDLPTPTSTSFNHHFRTSSLYDLSQISVPPTPSPVSRSGSGGAGAGRMTLDELGGASMKMNRDREDEPRQSNSLKLSIDPPSTSHKLSRVAAYPLHGVRSDSPVGVALSDAVKSPRLKMISDTLKSRTSRWVERRFDRSRSKSESRERERDGRRGSVDSGKGVQFDEDEERERERERRQPDIFPIRGRLSNAVDNLIEGFNGFSSKALGRIGSRSRSNSKSSSASASRSRSRDGRKAPLAVHTEVNTTAQMESNDRVYTPPPDSASPPLSSASSEAGELGEGEHGQEEEEERGRDRDDDPYGLRSRLRRRNHRRQASAPLLIYTDSASKSKIRPKNKLAQSSASRGPFASSSNASTSIVDKSSTSASNLPNTPTADATTQKASDNNPGLLLQVWMWFQFAVVVLVFVYAMAKRGPGSILAPGSAGAEGGAGAAAGKRAVARRRG